LWVAERIFVTRFYEYYYLFDISVQLTARVERPKIAEKRILEKFAVHAG